MARQEKYAKPGGKPTVKPATIHEDLRGRDFTINSIALSLNPASRGLLLDPNNGVGDLERKELRAVSNYTLYDDPIRLLRMLRFKVRLGFTIEERTKMQYDNAREAQLETRIAPEDLLEELRHIANEPNCADIVKVLEEEKLLHLFSPDLAGAKLNHAGLQKLQKARQLVPFGIDIHLESMGLFLYFLTEKLPAKDRAAFIKNIGLSRREVDQWQKLEAKAQEAGKGLEVGETAETVEGLSGAFRGAGRADAVPAGAFLRKDWCMTASRTILRKYLPTAQEVTDRDVLATGVKTGTPKFQKAREELILTRLDARPKKIPPPEETPVPGGHLRADSAWGPRAGGHGRWARSWTCDGRKSM